MDNTQLSTGKVIFPVALLALTVAISLGFQASALLQDRDTMQQVYSQQAKLIEQAGKVKGQVNALAIGTLHLSQNGNPDAQNIIAQLKKAGIDVNDRAQGGLPATAGAPIAATPSFAAPAEGAPASSDAQPMVSAPTKP